MPSQFIILSAFPQKRCSMQGIALMTAIKDSNFIVVDSHHHSVVIRYDSDIDEAPMIIARGNDLNAAYIQQIAKKFGVYSVENSSLAQALCKNCLPLFMPPLMMILPPIKIPQEYYQDVAEILVYLSRIPKEQK